ncbi:hypothetical protein DXG01_013040 [Tephrocybe rancida]|nr:hypothetical protein DXG01_013040 [Tephrocybe rancida]
MSFYIRPAATITSYLQRFIASLFPINSPTKIGVHDSQQSRDILYGMIDDASSLPTGPTEVIEWSRGLVKILMNTGLRGSFSRSQLPMKKLKDLRRFKVASYGPHQYHYYTSVTVAHDPDLLVNLQRSVSLLPRVEPPTDEHNTKPVMPEAEWSDIPGRVTTLRTLALLENSLFFNIRGTTVDCLTPDTPYVCELEDGLAEQVCIETILFNSDLHNLDILDLAIAALIVYAYRSKYNKYSNQSQWFSDLVSSIATRAYELSAGMKKGESRTGESNEDNRNLQIYEEGEEQRLPGTDDDVYENLVDELHRLYAKARQQLNQQV